MRCGEKPHLPGMGAMRFGLEYLINPKIYYKLILFYGPGSGSEKSTLSRLLHDTLQQKGIRTKYVAESDVLHLDVFAPYVEAVKKDNPGNTKVLISSCKRFINACSQSDKVYVVDSILPYSQEEHNEQDFSGGSIFSDFNGDRLFAR